MALEQRQTEIQEGAGLTESRLNRDFIDFLKKWGGVILLVILAITAGYLGLRRLSEHREQTRAAAFDDLEAARASGNPAGLVQLADEHSGQGAVPVLARLEAADAYRVAAYRGLAPGAAVESDGSVKDPKDILNAEGRERLLAQAATQYQLALDGAEADPGMAIQAISARFGLAAIAETRGQTEEARKQYEAAQAHATRAGFTDLAETAKRRIATMSEFVEMPVLLSRADVKTARPRPASNLPQQLTPEQLAELERTGTLTTPIPGSAPGPVLPPLLPPDEPPAIPGATPPVKAPPATPPASDPTKDTP